MRFTPLCAGLFLLLGACRTATVGEALATVEKDQHDGVSTALARAGDNAPQLATALATIEPDMRPGMVFLIATMPERDLTTLNSAFLLGNVRQAYASWRGAPWGHEIPEAMFFQYILPYVNLNERRDDWRGDFASRFQTAAWKHSDLMHATRWLNDNLNDALDVHYHASKRRKPDQSPYESMELGWASCTGLSILLVDACRSVGIPARCVGCPAWKVVQGNHTWVEVFGSDGAGSWRWFNIGDTGSDPRGENWVNDRCRTETDPDDWAHAVWAASWRPTGRHMPLPWEWEIDYVPGLNVTRFYTAPTAYEFHAPRSGPGVVSAYWSGELAARTALGNGATSAVLHLAKGEEFEIVTTFADGTRAVAAVSP
ncbi:MAG: transglutaminase-like domain-containing protein [Phycisphaerae bacterium]|nr:transglutaminase-like domain-containing protein [Phycisphaerae bacterium]